MKRIFLSLVMIVMASVVAVGATSAYFTNSAKILGESFATGTIKINLTGDDTYQNGSNRTVTLDHFGNLKPGDSMRQFVTLANAGTLDIDYLTVNKSNVVDPSGLLGQIIVSTSCGIVGGADAAFYTDDWGTKPTVSSWFNNSNILDETTFYRPAAGVIHTGQSYTCVMDFTLPATVSDPSFQGQTASFDMTFTAEQSH